MNRFWMFAMGATLAVAACDKPADDTDETGTDTDTDTAAAMTIGYNWDNDGFSGTVNNMTGAGFDLGFAETGSTGTPWNGEDCFNGTAGYNVCHSFTGNTAALTPVADPDDVVAGSTTLLSKDLAYNGDSSDRITYMLTLDGGDCFTWGQDVTYYSSFGCAAAPLE